MAAGVPSVTACTHRATRAPGLAVLSRGWMGQGASVGWQGVLTSHLASSTLPAFLCRLEKGC